MSFVLARNWWSLVLRGLAALLFGIVAFVSPGITLGALVLLFGAYAFIDGVLSLVGAVRASAAHERWAALLLEGVVGIVAGVVTIVWPAITVVALAALIGVWAVITGVLEIAAAWRLRKLIAGEWLLALTGIASLALGCVMLFAPLVGALALTLWIGAYALIFGVLMITLGLQLRSRSGHIGGDSSVQMPAH